MESIASIQALQTQRANTVGRLGASSFFSGAQVNNSVNPEAIKLRTFVNPQQLQAKLEDLKELRASLTSADEISRSRLLTEKSDFSSRSSALGGLVSELRTLRTFVRGLRTGEAFKGHEFRVTQDKSTDYATVQAQEGFTPEGIFTFNIAQLATSTTGLGTANLSKAANPYAAVTSNASGIGTAVAAGTITINGVKITINSDDILGTNGISADAQDDIQKDSGRLSSEVSSLFNYVVNYHKSEISKDSVEDRLDDVFDEIDDLTDTLDDVGLNQEKGIKDVRTALATLTSEAAKLQKFIDDTHGEKISKGALLNYVSNISKENIEVLEQSAGVRQKSVIDKINTAGAGVTAKFDVASDRITLTATNNKAISLGAAGDTSNFLQAAGLQSNGTKTVSSSFDLGALNLNSSVATSGLRTNLTTGSNGTLAFKINGTLIEANSGESLQTIIERINNSEAGVTLSFDSTQDRFVFTNKNTGSTAVTFEDTKGNFLTATGLKGSTQTQGKNLLGTLTLESGEKRNITSLDNIITAEESGVEELAVAVNKLETITSPGSSRVTLEKGFRIDKIDHDDESIKTSSKVNYRTGDAVQFSGALARRLDPDQTYYVRVDRNGKEFQLYTDQASALRGGRSNRVEFDKDTAKRYVPGSASVARQVVVTTPATKTNELTLTVEISQDADTVRAGTTIQEFVEQYNRIQKSLQSLTTRSSENGATAAFLGDSPEVRAISGGLRQSIREIVTGLDGSIKVNSGSKQVNLEEAKLQEALDTSFENVRNLFTNKVGARLDRYIDSLIGNNGTLSFRMAAMEREGSRIDKQLSALDEKLNDQNEKLKTGFEAIAMSLLGVNGQSKFLADLVARLAKA